MKAGSYSRRKSYAETYYTIIGIAASCPVQVRTHRERASDGDGSPEVGASCRKAVTGSACARIVSDRDGEAFGRRGYDCLQQNFRLRIRKARTAFADSLAVRAGIGKGDRKSTRLNSSH